MISVESVFQNDVIKIHLNKEHKYIQTVWLKLPTREEFKARTRLVASYITSFQVNKVLFDVRKRIYLEMADQIADQSWLEEEISPLVKNIAGLRFAYLVTQEGYESMYTSEGQGLLLDQSERFKHVEVGIFLEEQEAQDWLLNC